MKECYPVNEWDIFQTQGNGDTRGFNVNSCNVKNLKYFIHSIAVLSSLECRDILFAIWKKKQRLIIATLGWIFAPKGFLAWVDTGYYGVKATPIFIRIIYLSVCSIPLSIHSLSILGYRPPSGLHSRKVISFTFLSKISRHGWV